MTTTSTPPRSATSSGPACAAAACDSPTNMPAPTVAFVRVSIRMNEPVSRLLEYGSTNSGLCDVRVTRPMSFISRVVPRGHSSERVHVLAPVDPLHYPRARSCVVCLKRYVLREVPSAPSLHPHEVSVDERPPSRSACRPGERDMSPRLTSTSSSRRMDDRLRPRVAPGSSPSYVSNAKTRASAGPMGKHRRPCSPRLTSPDADPSRERPDNRRFGRSTYCTEEPESGRPLVLAGQAPVSRNSRTVGPSYHSTSRCSAVRSCPLAGHAGGKKNVTPEQTTGA